MEFELLTWFLVCDRHGATMAVNNCVKYLLFFFNLLFWVSLSCCCCGSVGLDLRGPRGVAPPQPDDPTVTVSDINGFHE